MKRARRRTEGNNLSFLDVVSCGFGAIVLLILIVKPETPGELPLPAPVEAVAELAARLAALQAEQRSREQALRRQEDALAAAREKAAAARARVRARVLEQSKAARQAEVATMTQDKIRKRLEAALQDLDEEMRRLRLQPDDDAKVGGLPVDSRYIVFIVDTSGSMKQRAWRQAEEQMIAILDAYPKVEGIQIMNDMGQYMFDQYRGRWIPDTPARRKAIVRHFRTWAPYSNSSPVEGILEAIRTYSSRSRKISLYIFGDEFSGPSGQAVIDEVERLNFSGGKGRRRVRIHALGFYTGAGATGQRFAALMRELTYRNGGTFIGL
ncbi:MAG: VWA domain-containing protein [Gammaproteobacteria bacterium]|nr:VWA domain-containing protein [Gammaproteobacteria bacterium]